MESRGTYGGAPERPHTSPLSVPGQYGPGPASEPYGGPSGGASSGAIPHPAPPRSLKERSFGIGLLLTIVTVGIYHYFWHWWTHDGLSRQMGVENKDKALWIVYIALALVSFALGLFGPDATELSAEPTAEELLDFFAGYLPFLALSGLMSLIMMVLFILYVSRQWSLVTTAKQRMGLRVRGSVGTFFLLFYGSIAIAIFFFWLIIPLFAPLIMIPIAYYLLNENYNDVARAIHHGQVDAHAYRPGGEGWQYGPARRPAPAGWPTDVPPGPAPASGYATQETPQTPPLHGSGAYGGSGVPWVDPRHRQPHTGHAHAPSGYQGPTTAPDPTDATSPPEEWPNGYVEQHFQCPRCHEHVMARGAPGSDVGIHCLRCGETGGVRLPEH